MKRLYVVARYYQMRDIAFILANDNNEAFNVAQSGEADGHFEMDHLYSEGNDDLEILEEIVNKEDYEKFIKRAFKKEEL